MLTIMLSFNIKNIKSITQFIIIYNYAFFRVFPAPSFEFLDTEKYLWPTPFLSLTIYSLVSQVRNSCSTFLLLQFYWTNVSGKQMPCLNITHKIRQLFRCIAALKPSSFLAPHVSSSLSSLLDGAPVLVLVEIWTVTLLTGHNSQLQHELHLFVPFRPYWLSYGWGSLA